MVRIFPVLRSETLATRGKLGGKRRIHGAAIELGEPQIAVEADAGQQGFAGCGIERLRQRTLLHYQLPAGGGGRKGLAEHAVLTRLYILPMLLILALVEFKQHRAGAA